MKKKEPMFEYLESIAELIPSAFWWMDLNCKCIGANNKTLAAVGALSRESFIGKTPHEFHTREIADELHNAYIQVMETKASYTKEDVVIDITTGQIRYFSTIRAPLHNLLGEIIGVTATAIEITTEKEAEVLKQKNKTLELENKRSIFEHLESMAESISASLSWLDVNGICLGLNTICLNGIGVAKKEDVIGKNTYDIYKDKDAAIAEEIYKVNNEVLKTGQVLQTEDMIIDVVSGKLKYFLATRTPLRNLAGEIIGLVDTAIDITAEKEAVMAQKEAEQLRFENERLEAENKTKDLQLQLENEANKAKVLEVENNAHKSVIEEQEKFKKAMGQMMHDMTSPIASINTIVSKLGSNIPENDRVTLRAAADRMEGISGRLLKQYENKDVNEQEESVVVSLALIQIMNEKKEEHLESGVKFVIDIDAAAKFCFIQHNSGIFKRMISNLVNNAVDALKSMDQKENTENDITEKKVTVTLYATTKNALIIIEDNGPGMPKHIQDMFNKGESMTEGKGDAGHGIGLTQVHDAITFGKGEFEVYATDKGTEIKIKFPLAPAPHWIATEVKLTKDDTILILDDDKSIHGAWDHKFKEILAKNPTLRIEHFTYGKDAIAYINKLTPEQKQNTFLLTDYELLEQGMNGLDVVEETQMKRAILVTSYATKANIQERVTKLGVRTLPKELVTAVEIKVDKKLEKGSKVVDMVWVEDQDWYVDGLVKKHYSHLKIDVFYDPVSFMECVIQYPFETKIILDTFYEGANGEIYMQTGYTLAKELHALGYTKLILLAGEDPKGRAPEYLQVVRKKDDASEILDKL